MNAGMCCPHWHDIGNCVYLCLCTWLSFFLVIFNWDPSLLCTNRYSLIEKSDLNNDERNVQQVVWCPWQLDYLNKMHRQPMDKFSKLLTQGSHYILATCHFRQKIQHRFDMSMLWTFLGLGIKPCNLFLFHCLQCMSPIWWTWTWWTSTWCVFFGEKTKHHTKNLRTDLILEHLV